MQLHLYHFIMLYRTEHRTEQNTEQNRTEQNTEQNTYPGLHYTIIEHLQMTSPKTSLWFINRWWYFY